MRYSVIFLTYLCLLGIGDRANAQIVVPNGSFEQWAVDSVPKNPLYANGTWFHPVDWNTTSGTYIDDTSRTIIRSTDAHTGMYALGGKVIVGDSLGPFVSSWYGTWEHGYEFPIKGTPTAFEGWYKLKSVGNDYLNIIPFFDNSALAVFNDSTSHDTYTHFSIPLPNRGDSGWVIIQIEVLNTSGILHSGTEFVIDDLALTGEDAVPAALKTSFALEKNYPNPFNSATTIRYSLGTDDNVTLEIFNILGVRIWSLDQGRQRQGEHQIVFDAEHLSSGPYLCRLITASQGIASQILQLSR